MKFPFSASFLKGKLIFIWKKFHFRVFVFLIQNHSCLNARLASRRENEGIVFYF